MKHIQTSLFEYKVSNDDLAYRDIMLHTAKKNKHINRCLHENLEARYIEKRWKGKNYDEV